MTPEGLPLGCEIFPGNTYEGDTLIPAVEKLAARAPGARLAVIADAGLLSKANEAALRARGIPFILGARLKSLPRALKDKVLDGDGCRTRDGAAELAGSVSSCRDIADGERRVIATRSERRARKDGRQREKAVEKLRKRLEKGAGSAALAGRGHARFLDFPGGKPALNPDKIAEAARWDGLRGVVAWGLGDADPRELVAQYRRLWEIEACFRANKHDLKIRPVFHRVERRVRAHVAICYMAFCCLAHLRHRLAALGTPTGIDEIRREPNALQVSVLERKGTATRIALPSRASKSAKRICRSLGLSWGEAPFRLETEGRGAGKSPERADKRP